MKTGEFKVLWLNDAPSERVLCDTPAAILTLWQEQVIKTAWFDAMKEACVVVAVNTRRRVIGFNLVTLGTLDTAYVHPREVFRPLLAVSAAAFVLTHNHPSGDSSPSEADVVMTRLLKRAGEVLKVEMLDHVIVCPSAVASGTFTSLKQAGYFNS